MVGSKKEKRILFASEFWHGSTGSGLANGFRQLGWIVQEIDYRTNFVGGKTIPLRIAGRLFHATGIRELNREIIDQARSTRPDIFLTIKGAYLSARTLATLKSLGVRCVNYYPDVLFNHAGFDLDTIGLYDLFFTTKSFHIEYLKKYLDQERIYLLHHGYSSLVHRPILSAVSESDYVADILYVGNYSPYKGSWVSSIIKGVPNARLMISGFGWEGFMGRSALNAHLLERPVIGDAYASLVQRAKINVAFHSGPCAPFGWEDQVSTRSFEIPACGGFMLHIQNSETESLFKTDSEIAVFSNERELSDQIVKYLPDSERRNNMISAAYARCVPNYSYESRAAVMDRTFV